MQAREAIRLLGLEDTAHTVSTMSPLSLMVCPSVKPVITRHLPYHFQVSAATFFENKHGMFWCWTYILCRQLNCTSDCAQSVSTDHTRLPCCILINSPALKLCLEPP